jgi:hydrogenase expression/formation protein HypD
MKYLDEFRDPAAVRGLARQLVETVGDRKLTVMEVCGTHTMSVARYGLKRLLPPSLTLLSGPGCPVCVTPNSEIDLWIAAAREPNVVLTPFGDLLRVPGSSSSLEMERSTGADVRPVYSSLEALRVAESEPDRLVVFPAVGFETTAPTVAASVLEAKRKGLSNFTLAVAHKTMPAAMEALAGDGRLNLDGFLCPAHVSTIIGAEPYRFLSEEHGKSCVVAGFEATDIVESLLMIAQQIARNEPDVEVQYRRVAKLAGNPKARETIDRVFEPCDAAWRGLGTVSGSGLFLRAEYADFDVRSCLDLQVESSVENPACRCGEVLRGLIRPRQCSLFGKTCTPDAPVGACMVSNEGSCAAAYRYRDEDEE